MNFCRLIHLGSLFNGKPSQKLMGQVVEQVPWRKLSVKRDELEISTVLACGQSFRWKNDGPDPLEWIGVFGNHLWILKQDENSVLYKAVGKDVATALPVHELEKLLWKYFQLDVSLPHLYEVWAKLDTKFANLTVTDYKGIRMLEQDPVENLFSFICSSNNNIQRISQMVEKMCKYYGEPIGTCYGKVYHAFPTIESLCQDGVEEKLREEKFGYRAGFIAKTAQKLLENGGISWINSLKKMEYEEANKQLQSLPGIGRKVADCICLMSLGFHEAIPIDTHMHALGKQYLPHLASVKTMTDKVYTEISSYFRNLYGEYSGWAHSVLFASTLRHLKVEKIPAPSKKHKISKPKTVVEATRSQLVATVSEKSTQIESTSNTVALVETRLTRGRKRALDNSNS